MIECLPLRRAQTHEPAAPGETILPALSYAPDYIILGIFFGPVYSIKAHLLTITALRVMTPRHETTRSLLDRALAMFREAAPAKDVEPDLVRKREQAVSARMQKATYMDIVSQSSANPANKQAPPSTGNGTAGEALGISAGVGDRMDTDPPHGENRQLNQKRAPSRSNTTLSLDTQVSAASATLLGRCGDVLAALIKLWDRRNEEFQAITNGGRGPDWFGKPGGFWMTAKGPPGGPPGMNGGGVSESSEQQHAQSRNPSRSGDGGGRRDGEEEEDELASDGENEPLTEDAQHMPLGIDERRGFAISSSPMSHIQPNTPGTPLLGNNPPPSALGMDPKSSSTGFTPAFGAFPMMEDHAELLGSSFSFDLAPFYDPSFYDSFMFDTSGGLEGMGFPSGTATYMG